MFNSDGTMKLEENDGAKHITVKIGRSVLMEQSYVLDLIN